MRESECELHKSLCHLLGKGWLCFAAISHISSPKITIFNSNFILTLHHTHIIAAIVLFIFSSSSSPFTTLLLFKNILTPCGFLYHRFTKVNSQSRRECERCLFKKLLMIIEGVGAALYQMFCPPHKNVLLDLLKSFSLSLS